MHAVNIQISARTMWLFQSLSSFSWIFVYIVAVKLQKLQGTIERPEFKLLFTGNLSLSPPVVKIKLLILYFLTLLSAAYADLSSNSAGPT